MAKTRKQNCDEEISLLNRFADNNDCKGMPALPKERPYIIRICAAVLILAFFFALSGCQKVPAESTEAPMPAAVSSETPTEAETMTPAETESPSESASESALSGLEDLKEGMILFFRQEDMKEKRGDLVPLADAEAAWYDGLFPRTHYYDPMFAKEEEQRLLRLLDYCLGNGYQGFCLPDGIVSTEGMDVWQHYALPFMYRIEDGSVLCREGQSAEGASFSFTTVWYSLKKEGEMDKFSQGLAAVRELAAKAPEGADDYDLLVWAMNALAERIVYGDRDSYYYTDGYQLYDAMVKGVTVCTGYSDAMYYLCNLIGVDCLCTEGNATSLTRDGGLDGHAWNFARIGEQYYVFDLTGYDCIVMQRLPLPVMFALSEEAMHSLGGNHRTDRYADAELMPSCDSCFDPVAAWNSTPEGAMRSFMAYYDLAIPGPEFMLAANDLIPEEWTHEEAEDGFYVLPVSYEDFLARTLEYMSESCFESCFGRFYRNVGGSLAVKYVTAEDDVELYQLAGVREEADGAFLAELARKDGSTVTVPFSAEETDGRYRISEISFK